MADFAPLISRAIAGLEKNTAENRRVLYDRARAALVAQLRSIDPPLSESEITRERLGLEEAIRRIESEIARGQRETSPRPAAPAAGEAAPPPAPPSLTPAPPPKPEAEPTPAAPPPAERKPNAFQSRIDRLPTGEGKQRLQAGLRDEKTLLEGKQEAAGKAGPAKSEHAASEIAATDPAKPGDTKPEGAAPAETGDAPAPAAAAGGAEPLPEPAAALAAALDAPVAPRGRQTLATAPASSPIAPRLAKGSAAKDQAKGPAKPAPGQSPLGQSPLGQSPLARPPYGQAPATGDSAGPEEPPAPRRAKIEPRPAQRPTAGRPRYDEVEMADEAAGGRARFWAIIVGLLVLALVAAGVGLLAASGKLPWFGSATPQQTEAPLAQHTERPKIADRIVQDEPVPPATEPQQQPQSPPPAQALQVAQRAILYEEDPAAGQQGQVLIGTVAWRTETVMPGNGLPPDLAVRAEVQVPDRRMSATLTLRRNVDAVLPASHTIELVFATPPDFPFGGVAKVPGILAKRGEGQRGAPLAGLAVDVTAGFFIVGLSAIEADVQRNLQLLKERAWLDIPLVYKNGRRAILSIEKGLPGDRVFNEAFTAWGQ